MTTLVLKNAYVHINGVDYSAAADSVALTYDADQLDSTTFGADTHLNKPGLLNWTLTVGLKADYSAAGLDSDLFALVGAAAFTVAVRPDNSTKTTSNPEFNGSATLKGYDPISGKVGELVPQTLNFVAAGSLSRLTS